MKYLFIVLLMGIGMSGRAQQAGVDVQKYRYELELRDGTDAITGKAIVTVKFLSPSSQLKLDLGSFDNEKGMQAFSVKEGQEVLTMTHVNDVLSINLNKPAAAGEVRSFEINYMGVPRDGLIISTNKYGERTFFGDNWPNRAHQWIPCNDRPDDKAQVEFVVTAPSAYRVIANGLMMEEKANGPSNKTTIWKEDIPIPTKVMVIGAAHFAVARVDSSYKVPVTSWVYPQDSAKGVFDYSLADDILRFFDSYVAPYPYKKLANVQSKTIFGGMENANAIFYAENTVTGTRSSEALLAHEIAHQWFGNTATEKSFPHLWLSEGFATYMTDLYFENKYGPESIRKRLEKERTEIIAFAKESRQPVVDSVSPLMDLLNANSYQKGSWFLHMLRREVGDSSFHTIIRNYYNQYKNGNADTRDFEAVAEKVAGRDLKWFFDQWLYQPGVPELNFDIKQEKDEVKIKITQTGKTIYRFSLDIEVISKDGRTLNIVNITGKEAEFKYKGAGPLKVNIDPSVNLLYSKKN